MTPVRMLLIAALPLLVMSSEVQQCDFQSTPHLLESLQCYNDYTTHIRCTWEEDSHTHLHVVIVSDEKESTCIPDSLEVPLPNGKLYRSCIYKTQIFSWGNRTVFFNTSLPSKATTLKIAQHGKVLSPVNVSEKEVDGGSRRLSWNSPYPLSSRLTSGLSYQVKFRRHGHDWTVVDNRTATHHVIERDDLMPGYSYEARVRARGRTGLWSDWSPPVFWITKEEGAFNLQCVIVEDGVLCSWQVKQEHTQFFSYHLCWRTNGSNQTCNSTCCSHSKRTDHGVLDFTCTAVTSEPELLTVELKSIRICKDVKDPLNIQTSRPSPVQVQKKNGDWMLTWSRPKVTEKLKLNYQLRLECNETRDYKEYSTSDGEFTVQVPSSSLLPAATYIVQVRTLPPKDYSGQPSDWSDPVDLKNDQASSAATIIYILIGVLVAIFFIILYNALPACHRRLVLWKVSIPSPIKSKVLGEISSMMSPGAWVNPYCETEKTAYCVMQPSDNSSTCKSRNSESPHFPSNSDSFTKSDWTHGSDLSPPNTEGSVVSVKSSTSFIGPYILCSQESSLESETLDTSFYSTFDEDGSSIIDSNKDSPPENVGYVSSPPTSLPSMEQSTPPDIQSLSSHPASEGSKPNPSQLPMGDPPAYTPNPNAMGAALFSHPSGYCLMPRMDMDNAVWVQASAPPPVANTESQTNQSARGYVTLSQPAV